MGERKLFKDLEPEIIVGEAYELYRTSNFIPSEKRSRKFKAKSLGLYSLAADKAIERYEEMLDIGDILPIEDDYSPGNILASAAEVSKSLGLEDESKNYLKESMKWFSREYNYMAAAYHINKFYGKDSQKTEKICKKGIESIKNFRKSFQIETVEDWNLNMLLMEQIEDLRETLKNID